MLRPSASPVLQLPGVHQRAWLHAPGDLSTGALHHPVPTASGLADFYQTVAAAEPNVVFMPYLGVWDGQGRRVYAYDLLQYGESWGDETETVYGIALYDDRDVSDHGEDYFPRYHYDVEQVTTASRGERDVAFWQGIHEYDGGEIHWPSVDVVGNLFEDAEMLRAWGVPFDLGEVLRRLRLTGAARWGSLRPEAA